MEGANRADRFVADWKRLERTSLSQYQAGNYSGYKSTRATMGEMAKSLQRDPQLESLLATRKQELGIAYETGRSLGQQLASRLGLGRGRGNGL